MGLIATSRDLPADEAYRLGLLDRLGDEDVVAGAVQLARRMGAWPPLAVRVSKPTPAAAMAPSTVRSRSCRPWTSEQTPILIPSIILASSD